MFISNCSSKFLSLDNGLSIFLQQRDDGGIEYDIFQTHCEPIDGGILDDENLEEGLTLDSNILCELFGPKLAKRLFGDIEDHVLFALEDEGATAMREAIEDYGCAEPSVLAKLKRVIQGVGSYSVERRNSFFERGSSI